MDWNNDGLKDLLVGEYYGKVRYYRNIGVAGQPQLTFDGYLQAGGSDVDVDLQSSPWVDDWNEDGRKDLLVGARDGMVYLYINTGTDQNPTFDEIQQITLADGTLLKYNGDAAPVVVDLDNDGLKDLVVGEFFGRLFYHRNTGTNAEPQLAAADTIKAGNLVVSYIYRSKLTVFDWDDDGALDILVGSINSHIKLLLQRPTSVPAPTVDLTLNSPYPVPGEGDTLDFSIRIENPTNSEVHFDVWAEVLSYGQGAWGFEEPFAIQLDDSLGPHETTTLNIEHDVPGDTPMAYFMFFCYVGNFEGSQIFGLDHVPYHKLAPIGVEERDPLLQIPHKSCIDAFPNPFNPVTTVSYYLPKAGALTLDVYSTSGQKVENLETGYHLQGNHLTNWNASGYPSGVYLIRLRNADFQISKKVLLLK